MGLELLNRVKNKLFGFAGNVGNAVSGLVKSGVVGVGAPKGLFGVDPTPQNVQNTVNSFKNTFTTPSVSNLKTNVNALSTPESAREWQAGFNEDPLGDVLRAFTNNYIAPATQIPYATNELFGKDKTPMERGIGALQFTGNTLSTLTPGVSDLVIGGVNAAMGGSKSVRQGGSIQDILTGAKRSATGQDLIGLGDALTDDPTGQAVGNLAQIPLMLLAGGLKTKNIDENTQLVARAVKEGKVTMDEGTAILDSLKKTPTQNLFKPAKGKIKTTLEDATVPMLDVIKKSGKTGEELASKFKSTDEIGARLAGDTNFRATKFLDSLNDKELETFADATQGTIAPISKNQSLAIEEWRKIDDEIFNMAKDAGLDVKYREKHFPRFLDKTQKVDAATEEVINSSLGRNAPRRFGNLELPRETEAPYIKNPKEVIPNYIENSIRRITDAKAFGANDEELYKLARQAGKEGGNSQQVIKYVDQLLGKNQNLSAESTAKTLTKIQSFKMNPFTSLRNLTQNFSTVMRTDPSSVASGTKRLLADPEKAKEIWIKSGLSGTDFDAGLQELAGNASKYVRGIGMKGTEKVNRMVAVNSGYSYAEKLSKQYSKGSDAAFRELKNLGFTMDEIKAGLKESDFITAGRRVSQETQFSSNKGMLPYAWGTPAGKVVTQYKPFGYQQTGFVGKLIKRTVIEAGKGNLKPLGSVVFGLGSATVAGEVLNGVYSWYKNKERTDTESGGRRLVSDLLAGFSVGLVDSAPGLLGEYGAKGVLSTLGGPTAGTVLDAGEAALKTKDWFQGDKYAGRVAARDVLKQIPVVGGTIANTVVPNSYVDNKDIAGTNLGVNNGLTADKSEVYKKMLNFDKSAAENYKQENKTKSDSVLGTKDSPLNKWFGKKEELAIPSPKAKKEEVDLFNKSVDEALQNGGQLSPDVIKSRFFDGKTYDQIESSTEKSKAMDDLVKVMDNEYYTDEQKDSIASALGVPKEDADYYRMSNLNKEDRTSAFLDYAETAKHDDLLMALALNKRRVAGHAVVDQEIWDRMYDEGYISKDEKSLLTNIKWDSQENKFYMDRDYKGGGMSDSEKRSYIKSVNSIFATKAQTKSVYTPKLTEFSSLTTSLPKTANKGRSTGQWFDRY